MKKIVFGISVRNILEKTQEWSKLSNHTMNKVGKIQNQLCMNGENGNSQPFQE